MKRLLLLFVSSVALAGCSPSAAQPAPTATVENKVPEVAKAASDQKLPLHPSAANPAEPSDSDQVLQPRKSLNIHVRVTKENWDAMQPKSGGFPGFGPPGGGAPGGGPPGGGFGPPPNPGEDQKGTDGPPENGPPQNGPPQNGPPRSGQQGGGFGPPPNHRPGSFGFEFEYVKADVEIDGTMYKDVGLRFKGNGTYLMSAASKKRPMKIDFNRFVDDQRFFGLQQLNLLNNVMDPTHVRTALSYPVFAKAGIPSPRTAFAEVRLTIEGDTDNELIGLYTIAEEIDKAFLRRHYATDEGMLLKPEGTQGMEYKGEDWADYAWFEPKSKPSKAEQNRLIELTRLIEKADDEKFRREIGEILCVDQFARFLAANVVLSNMDSFLTNVHNYYVYLPPNTNRFEFLPWDLDLSLGTFFLAGQPDQLADLSIAHPHVGANKLIERLMEWDQFQTVYHEHLKKLSDDCLSESGILATELPEIRSAIADALKRDEDRSKKEIEKLMAQAPAGGPGGFGPPRFGGPGAFNPFANVPPIEDFVSKRRKSIAAQLAGTSEGTKPGNAFSFGPPPPPGNGRP